MSKQKTSKLKGMAREIGRFIITIPVYIVVMMLSAKLGCGRIFNYSHHSCESNNPFLCSDLMRGHPALYQVCNTHLAILTGTAIVAVILGLLAWKRKIVKAWVVDFVILMIITLIAGAVVDWATRTSYPL